jgi:DNA-directed RNA polymerase specialized sigma24 family protein
MTRRAEITQDNFEQLLNWLDPSRETAAVKYESIRTRLIKIFYARGCFAAEELADETIDRVTKKSANLASSYSGDPALFFYGVAKKVLLEFSRRPRYEELPRNITCAPDEETEDDHAECLDTCLAKLESDQQKLILDYYEGEKQAKIDRRKKLQADLGISSEALRVRVLRIRAGLHKCVTNCVRGRLAETH